MNDEPICPLPPKWAEIHGRLLAAWRAAGDPKIPEPPRPLILAAWHTPHIHKVLRWRDTLAWANQHGFADLIPNLEAQDLFYG